jgi:alpha-mannosidase
MWIVGIPVPKNAARLVFAHDERVHIFAATLAHALPHGEPYGLSVLNEGKYGFDVESNVFRLTALRSSSNPDPQPDKGIQKFTYSLYPHAGGTEAAHTEETALALNIPLLPIVTTPHASSGRMPAVTVENTGGHGDLVVSALKASEDGHGFVLRFYEAAGQDTEARIACAGVSRIVATDLLERPLADSSIAVHDNSAIVPVGHNQIVALAVYLGSEK